MNSRDSELLARYLDKNDETAFSQLVDLYGGMVLGAARNVTGELHTAKEFASGAGGGGGDSLGDFDFVPPTVLQIQIDEFSQLHLRFTLMISGFVVLWCSIRRISQKEREFMPTGRRGEARVEVVLRGNI